MANLLRLVPEPPSGYVAFVARNLESVRAGAIQMVDDVCDADRLYPEALTDVAIRWHWLELQRRTRRRAGAAEEYLGRALTHRWQRLQSEQKWAEAESDGAVDIQVLRPDEPIPRWSGPSSSAAVRLAPQVTPAARSTFAPVAEAAIAWWHAYETRRRRRLLAALVAALILAAGLLRLQNPLASTASVRAPVSVAAALAAR